MIVSALELPLFKGSKRVFVRDAHLFVIGKYDVIDRWFVLDGSSGTISSTLEADLSVLPTT